jgi:transcriptional regulator with PAS, ATPase and Fis domain
MEVRIVAATNQDLLAMVENFNFRSDLYFRLNAYQIHVPPLRERADDIPELAGYLIQQYAETLGRPVPNIRPDGLQLLKQYSWPGNVRELRNVMERCILTAKGDDLTPCDMPDHLCSFLKDGIPSTRQNNTNQNPFDLQANEKQAIIDALQQTSWNQSRAAKLLNITRNTLRYRMRKLDIQQAD